MNRTIAKLLANADQSARSAHARELLVNSGLTLAEVAELPAEDVLAASERICSEARKARSCPDCGRPSRFCGIWDEFGLATWNCDHDDGCQRGSHSYEVAS